MGGCLTKLVLWGAAGLVFVWLVIVALNPWALHIGGQSTPLLYWHGVGTVVAQDGRSYPLYLSFWPGRPRHHRGGILRREGKGWSSDVNGAAWLCVTPGHPQKMQVSGAMYGGYTSTADSLFDLRVIEWRKAFAINYQYRGFFDVAGVFEGPDLVLNRPHEQGLKMTTGPYIDHATARLHWASYAEFEAACR